MKPETIEALEERLARYQDKMRTLRDPAMLDYYGSKVDAYLEVFLVLKRFEEIPEKQTV